MADSRNGGDGKNKSNGASSSGAKDAYEMNIDGFVKRLKLFYKCWDDHKEIWGSADGVSIMTPPPADVLRYLKSSAMNFWLLGYEFPETLMVFMRGALHVLCGQRKANLLEGLKRPAKSCGVDLVLHIKAKNDDGASQMMDILEAVKSQSRSNSPTMGVLTKEPIEGEVMKKWDEILKSSDFDSVDASAGFSELFAVKDETEHSNIRKAALLSANVLKDFVNPKLELVIDEEKTVTHEKLMEETEGAILDPGKFKMRLKPESTDICYPPIFQSGGKFDLKASAVSNEDKLCYEATAVIVCALGARYNLYCSNIARTYLIDAEKSQEKAYRTLLKAQEAVINALRPGSTLSGAYKAALNVVEREAPELAQFLTKSAGTGIGIEFREAGLMINLKNERVVKQGMVFNVNLGFHNLELNAEKVKNKNYSILLADTVIVTKDKPENLTVRSSKAFSDIAYSFKTEEEEEPEKRKPSRVPNGSTSGYVKTALRSDNQEITKEEQRRQNQAELALRKNEETARRLAAGAFGHGEGPSLVKTTGEVVAYNSVDDMPTTRELMIHVDQKNEAVLLPIYGLMVPFHISSVKTVANHQDAGHSYVRIMFNVPGAGFSPNDIPVQKFPHNIYVKEISFRSTDMKRSTQIVQQLKTLKRHVAQRESEKAERATLVTQEKLQLSRGKPIRLSDLWIRPPFPGRKKMPGTLEAHINGFRYSTMKADETVDILYRNIQHAIFQPAENEMITLLHFHLHNHIMVGNKKTKDVQFFVEVMEVVQTLGGGRRSHYDPDEIEEEQAERERKNKLNNEFNVFVKRVADHWENVKNVNLEFDLPFRELGFHGVPGKSSAFIIPTSSCLVELIEYPFMVVSLNDIEIVNLERVGFAQKAFDMAIVFKDFKKDVLRIDAIPSSSLDGIKEWLNTVDIKYYESRLNMNWKAILKTILDDPAKFIADGGWEFLNLEASDSDSERSAESDAGYEPSDMEEPSESEDEDSDNESVVQSEDDEEEMDEDSEEEAGKTWDELEAEARKDDKNAETDDSEDEKRRRKAKMAGKARVPESRDSRGGPSSKRPKMR